MITADTILPLLTPVSATGWPPSTSGRCAAVLVPLVWEDAVGHIVFTERGKNLAEHAGQISFPGGAREPQDASPIATALRETQEEIGVVPDSIRLLGSLDSIRTSSGFEVVPVVGQMPWPVEFRLDTTEVESIFIIPWTWFRKSGKLILQDGCPTSYSLHYPSYHGREIWGATAMITMDLVNRLPSTDTP